MTGQEEVAPIYPRACFRSGHNRAGRRLEWWAVYTGPGARPHFVKLDLDPVWLRESASINDVKALAIAALEEVKQ